MQREGHRPPIGSQIRAHTEARGQAERGAGSGDYEFIATSSHYTIVCCIRISENDVRRPGTVRPKRTPKSLHTYLLLLYSRNSIFMLKNMLISLEFHIIIVVVFIVVECVSLSVCVYVCVCFVALDGKLL